MKLYWDIDRGLLVTGMNNPQPVTNIEFKLRDLVSVTLLTVKPSTTGYDYYTLTDPDAGQSPFFGAKPPSALNGEHFASTAVWTKTTTGTFTGMIALTGALLIAAVEEATTTYALTGEFCMVDVGGNNYVSSQFTMTVVQDVTRGGESFMVMVNPAGGYWAVTMDENGEFLKRRIV